MFNVTAQIPYHAYEQPVQSQSTNNWLADNAAPSNDVSRNEQRFQEQWPITNLQSLHRCPAPQQWPIPLQQPSNILSTQSQRPVAHQTPWSQQSLLCYAVSTPWPIPMQQPSSSWSAQSQGQRQVGHQAPLGQIHANVLQAVAQVNAATTMLDHLALVTRWRRRMMPKLHAHLFQHALICLRDCKTGRPFGWSEQQLQVEEQLIMRHIKSLDKLQRPLESQQVCSTWLVLLEEAWLLCQLLGNDAQQSNCIEHNCSTPSGK